MTWHDKARQWLRRLFATSRRFDVEVVRERGWGSIWTVTTDTGRHWFKAAHPALRSEAALRQVLERHTSEHVVPMTAVHSETGWFVTKDQGATLAAGETTKDSRHLAELAVAAGRIQQAVPVEDLTALSLELHRPEDAVINLDHVLAWFAHLPADHPTHIDTATRVDALQAMEHQVRRWSSVDPGLGLAIDHNDLHLGNAFPGPVISDWGDAVISHPFCTMRTVFLNATSIGADTRIIEDAYLRLWGTPADLREALHVATRLAVCQRLRMWCLLDDPDLVATYTSYITPMIHEIGRQPTIP